MRNTYTRLLGFGAMAIVLSLLLSGCFLRATSDFIFTEDISEFVDVAIDGESNVALCFDEELEDGSTFVRCTYAFADDGIL